MTTLPIAPPSTTAAAGPVSGPADDVVTAAVTPSKGPNFHVGVRGRMMIAFTGLMITAGTALYMYGQLAPGV